MIQQCNSNYYLSDVEPHCNYLLSLKLIPKQKPSPCPTTFKKFCFVKACSSAIGARCKNAKRKVKRFIVRDLFSNNCVALAAHYNKDL